MGHWSESAHHVCGFTSLPTSSLHQCLQSNWTLVCSPLSALTEALPCPGSRHTAAQQVPAPLQGPGHSALICFPNLSLSGISAVTQKAAIHMDHLPVSFSSALFLCVLYLSISLPLLSVSGYLSRCNPRSDGWPTEPTLSA